MVHSADDSVIPVRAADQMITALGTAGVLDVHVIKYDEAPGPPMPEFEAMVGHGSYEIAFRSPSVYTWLLRQRCARCGAKPLAPWHAFK